MIRVFADTSFIVATIDPRDPYRVAARNAFLSLESALIHTTQEVFGETLTFLSAKKSLRKPAIRTIRGFHESPNFVVHPQSEDSFEAAIKLFEERPDKHYSFVDCVAMTLMKRLDIGLVLSNDRHFAQEGFTLLY